jgi:hypothetical protein
MRAGGARYRSDDRHRLARIGDRFLDLLGRCDDDGQTAGVIWLDRHGLRWRDFASPPAFNHSKNASTAPPGRIGLASAATRRELCVFKS